MNILKRIVLWMSVVAITPLCTGAALVEEIGKKAGVSKFFPTIVQERQERLAARKKERADLLASDKDFISTINTSIDQLKNQISLHEDALKINPNNEFIKQKLEIALEKSQALNNLKYARAQVIALIDELNKLDQEYLSDPDLKKFAQPYTGKETYSFDEDLLSIYEKILEREKDVAALTEQESNASAELQNKKRVAQTVSSSLLKKEAENSMRSGDSLGLNAKQKAELETLNEQLAVERKAADAMRVTEAEYKYLLAQTKLFNAKKQLEELKSILRSIKPLTKINEAEIALALEDIDKKKQQVRPIKDEYRQGIEKLTTEIKNKEKETEALSKRFNIPLGTELDNWAKEAKPTARGHLALAQVGTVNDELLVLKLKKMLMEAQLALEDEKLQDEALRIEVKDTFFKAASGYFSTEENLGREIKKYQIQKDENKTVFALYKERQNALASIITTQKRALENITQKLKVAQESQHIFKDSSLDYEQYVALLKHAQEKIQEQLDLLGKIAAIYTEIISTITHAGKYIDFIIAELASITPWGRPEHAISWDGIKNIAPDVQSFFKDVKSYIATLNFASLTEPIKDLLYSPWQLILFLIKLLLVLLIVFIVKMYLPYITQKLVSIEQAPFGIRWISILTAVFLGFGIKHLISIVIWITAFIFLMINHCVDPHTYILFCLISIPYLIYLANRWMRYLVYINEKYDYCFLSPEYQNRFVYVFSTLLYATITIVFFREAFIASNYHKSELPTILLAINFIIFQISAILLLSKDQILSLISTKTDFGKWVYELVDTYYYLLQLFLIAIIVMSNPYVGYGRLVLYILKRIIYTAILIQLLIWIHEWLKRVTSSIFFYFDADEEIARDRFRYAKTWYGILVVLIFTAFTFFGLLIAARIWHWPEVLLKVQNWSDVVEWIKTPFLLHDTRSPISLNTIFTIFGFILAGSLIAFAINRFVLGRIFDILLVDSGVQNTVASLTRYLIIVTAIILGFNAVNLGELVWYLLGALILGIGWVIKDPAADLIAYFIIIVQRPVKVGDYVFLDENTNGVVRRITPRSVEMRRFNSTTIIVPNTMITTRNVANWNHARGFIAFNDIMVTVPYKVDPEQVRELLMRVLNESKVILKNPRPIVRLENFTDLGFLFLVRGFLSSNHTLDMWDIASDVRLAIVKRLREQGIEIAYPVRVVVTNSGMIDRKNDPLMEERQN